MFSPTLMTAHHRHSHCTYIASCKRIRLHIEVKMNIRIPYTIYAKQTFQCICYDYTVFFSSFIPSLVRSRPMLLLFSTCVVHVFCSSLCSIFISFASPTTNVCSALVAWLCCREVLLRWLV